MNRKILFRGKRVDNGEWTEGYFFKSWDKVFLLWGMTGDCPNMEEVVPETIGQFTGLCDKNGNEIYEGDILEFDGAEIPEEERAVVIYADGRFGLKNPKYDYMDDLDSLTASMEIIVGNTYDGIYRRNEQ